MKNTLYAFLLFFSVNIVAAQTPAPAPPAKPAAPATLHPGQDVPLEKLETSELARVNQELRACAALEDKAMADWKLAESERQNALAEQAKLAGQVIERAKAQFGVSAMYDNRGSESGHFPVVPSAPAEAPKPTPPAAATPPAK